MLLDLSDDERLLRDSVAAFAAKSLQPQIRPYVARHEFPTELVKSVLRARPDGHLL